HTDADDMFADTRMSFGDHIEELRHHLWRGIVGFLICLVGSLAIGKPVLRFIARPVEAELQRFYERRAERIQASINDDPVLQKLNKRLKIGVELKGEDGQYKKYTMRIPPLEWAAQTQAAARLFTRPPLLATMGITEGFMVFMKVSIVTGLV